MNVLIQFDKIGSLYAREKIVGLVESTSYAYFNERRGVVARDNKVAGSRDGPRRSFYEHLACALRSLQYYLCIVTAIPIALLTSLSSLKRG